MRTIDRRVIFDLMKRNRRRERAKRETGLYPLETVNLFVTMRCNAKCDHCFCWQDLNVGIAELSLDEYERVAENFLPIRILVITGGEPTLRKDLLDVARAFARRDKTESVLINTNGLKPDLLEEIAIKFKEEFPYHGLFFQLSLDGLEETHDRIRAVPGNFNKVIESLQRLWKLRERFDNFTAVVLTIITDQNYRELVPLNDLLRREVAPDFYQGFELMRDVDTTAWNINPEVKESDVGPKNMGLPPVEDFDKIARDLTIINQRNDIRADAYHVHNLAQLEMVKTGRAKFPCLTAGQSVGVFYSNGDIAHCEFTTPFANIKDFDYNFRELWHSEAADRRRRQIKGCHCIHGSFHGKNVEYYWKTLGKMAMQSVGVG